MFREGLVQMQPETNGMPGEWVKEITGTCLLENVEHCGGEPEEPVQECYVTDEWMSDVTSSKFKFLMFSASWYDGPLTI